MTTKQENIVDFIQRNTKFRLEEPAHVSQFIKDYWEEAQNIYEKRKTGRYRVSEREVDLYNFAGDNGMNEYEAENVLGEDYPIGGIHCAGDM